MTTPWMTPAEVADYARMHPKTVEKALRAGQLVGHQRCDGGRWLIHQQDADAWIRGLQQRTRRRGPRLRSA
ncbi:hypothetical protein GCM10012275_38640 [Longimycelium tulufanense]|uniref:Helix-turn-helix domain-containing protein n=1 Tax=Longimycelium tulufanense TaxID=907463 RepID=A0A8J3CHZ6_9PSEU|nr:helix-turn-helix domain-containing protein [Longimycelium tulufanense]GGM64339.1 hypothetical protein GCM10012275_38640 [Longimycelium tulufanense]